MSTKTARALRLPAATSDVTPLSFPYRLLTAGGEELATSNSVLVDPSDRCTWPWEQPENLESEQGIDRFGPGDGWPTHFKSSRQIRTKSIRNIHALAVGRIPRSPVGMRPGRAGWTIPLCTISRQGPTN